MVTLQGDGAPTAPVSFPTMFPELFPDLLDVGAAARGPFGLAGPMWAFYAAAASSGVAMWTMAQSMRAEAIERFFALAQQSMMKPMEDFMAASAVAPETLVEPGKVVTEAAQGAVDLAEDAAEIGAQTTADLMPTRIETAGELEPAMVGGESAPISPVVAAPAETRED